MFSHKNNNLLLKISDKFRKNDENKVYLFTNARDEPNISEWIAHHLLLGFDRIYVFDHKSKEPIGPKLNTNFDQKVFIRRVDGDGNIKIKLMNDAVNISKKRNVSWMLYLDADEFLLLNNYSNVKDMLHMFKNADAIGINWLFFGSSGHVKQPPGLITENFIKSEIRLDQHVKSFVRPETVSSINSPHFYIINNPSRYYAITGTKKGMNPFNKQPVPFIKVAAYVAHYVMQSEEEYLRRKGRPADDGSGIRTCLISNFHENYNDVLNNQLQNKYSQRIRDFLKMHNICL